MQEILDQLFVHLVNFGLTTLHAKRGLCACSSHAKSRTVILSMPRANTSDPYHLGVDSKVFEDDESETEAKTNSGLCVRLLSVRSPLFACKAAVTLNANTYATLVVRIRTNLSD